MDGECQSSRREETVSVIMGAVGAAVVGAVECRVSGKVVKCCGVVGLWVRVL